MQAVASMCWTVPRDAQVDAAILDGARTGTTGGFERLFERYHRPAFSLALRILGDREDAAEVTQEAFLRVHKNLKRFRGDSSFYTWMRRIVTNLAIDRRRRKARAEQLFDDRRDNAERCFEETVADPHASYSPRRELLRDELADVMREGFASLDERHRRVLILREVDGLTYEEIAAVTDVPVGTVMSRLFHARRRMRAAVSPYVEQELEVGH